MLNKGYAKTQPILHTTKKAIIHGANEAGKKFYMRSNYIFDYQGFIDRSIARTDSEFDGIPIYADFSAVPNKDVDYIFSMVRDYDGVLREYSPPPAQILSMLHTHQPNKQQQFCALANEIHRKRIPGAVAELGVDYGDTAKYINLFFEDRKMYLFDTFKGFSVTDIDIERELGILNEEITHLYDNRSNEKDVLRRMYYPEQCIMKKGLFPDSLDGLEDAFAFVHIDCDLSKPINAALDYFYPRLSKGGYICVHDYFNVNFTGVEKTVRKFTDERNIQVIPIVDYQGVLITK